MGKQKVLFVCLGNICRSPSAEALFTGIVKNHGGKALFEIDSAGTYAYHEGEPADARMQRHALIRGYDLTSISRPFKPDADWDRFDYIIAMDRSNMRDLEKMARDKNDLTKLHLMMSFSENSFYQEVPDPYYGGDNGFELVLDLLEDAGEGLFKYLKSV